MESLARTIPDQNARILIYCNNNFANAEVYELAPLIDLKASRLEFE